MFDRMNKTGIRAKSAKRRPTNDKESCAKHSCSVLLEAGAELQEAAGHQVEAQENILNGTW